MTYKLWNMLAEMKADYEWVELSHSMNNDSPVWSGIPAGSVEVGKVCYDWGTPMLECLIQTFKFPGQYGTHIDFPGHFIKEGTLSEAFGAEHAFLMVGGTTSAVQSMILSCCKPGKLYKCRRTGNCRF